MKRGIVVIFLLLMMGAGVLVFYYYTNVEKPSVSSIESIECTADSLKVQEEPIEILYGMVVNNFLVVKDTIEPNQNLSEILTSHNVSLSKIDQLAKSSKKVFDVRKIRSNKQYTLLCEPDSNRTASFFIYEPSDFEYVVFDLKDSIEIYSKQKKIDTLRRSVAGYIKTSLSDAMSDLGLDYELTDSFADVFSWQLDFGRLQKNDWFKLVYEDLYVDGRHVGFGDIITAQFNHYDTDYFAFSFDQCEGLDYFDEKGNSLRKAFLKDPLTYSRISSRYSKRRFHPVQKRYKAHLGTDYAARTGTPIRAVGDGIVEKAQYSKYNGNYVKIRHNGTFSTQYLHMSRIASGVQRGGKVKQGQTIGYVGSTGLATGPHLCYRFWKNGQQVDALKVEIPPAKPISQEYLAQFDIAKDSFMQELDQIQMPRIALILQANSKN